MFDQIHIILFVLSNCLTGVSFYYLGHRGLAGVKSDLADVKMDLERLKLRFSTPVVPTPVVVVDAVQNHS